MTDEKSHLSAASNGQSNGSEVLRLTGEPESDSWHSIRLNSDTSSEHLRNQVTWFIFVTLSVSIFIF